MPEDELGNGYEYLIKQFADDSGHTAQEFYTNRTLVHLMAQMLEPQPGERIYDPTVGTGGMLISALAEVKRRGGDTRTLGLYGQELIHITAAIARMNLVLHGVEDFEIAAGNTLSNPAFIERDRLRTFDVVLANPPYSIKKWNREAWQSDPWGRNFLGTPPQGRADYAFFQHILKSLDPKTGRCAILFPHGVLFRNEEAEMRRKLVESDLLECVLGLGPNLFYNSPMEACVVDLPDAEAGRARRGKILFIDAVHEVARERAQSFLKPEHQQRILAAYRAFADEPGFAKVATIDGGAREGRQPVDSALRQADRRDAASERRPTISKTAWAAFDAERPGVLAADGRARGHARRRRCRGGRRCLSRPRGRAGRASRSARCATHVNDRVDDPAEPTVRALRRPGAPRSGVDLTIRRWGDIADVEATIHQRFRPGEILFGKRRAYQRKVAVADFDGICSAHDNYVLRAEDPNVLLPEFLPFFMQTRSFHGARDRRSRWARCRRRSTGRPREVRVRPAAAGGAAADR